MAATQENKAKQFPERNAGPGFRAVSSGVLGADTAMSLLQPQAGMGPCRGGLQVY